MPGKVRTKAYPWRTGWGWCGCGSGTWSRSRWRRTCRWRWRCPASPTLSTSRRSGGRTGRMLFDNFVDGLHAPYLHRTSPQFLLYRLFFRTAGREPGFDAVEHDGKILRGPLPAAGRQQRRRGPPHRARAVSAAQVVAATTAAAWAQPRTSCPASGPAPFLHGLPSYIHTVHEEQYFTQFIIPIDRDHLYSMCAMTGIYSTRDRRYWTSTTTSISARTTRCSSSRIIASCATPRWARERLSPWDQDVIRWRKFAVRERARLPGGRGNAVRGGHRPEPRRRRQRRSGERGGRGPRGGAARRRRRGSAPGRARGACACRALSHRVVGRASFAARRADLARTSFALWRGAQATGEICARVEADREGAGAESRGARATSVRRWGS